MRRKNLTGRQRKFVAYYLGRANGNATEAARLAGYSDPNAVAHRLMNHPTIREAIDRRADRLAKSQAAILAGVNEISEGDIGVFIPPGGGPITWESIKASGKSHLIKRVVPTKQGLSVELYDRFKAHEILGRYSRLWAGPAENAPRLPNDLSGYSDAQITLLRQGKDPGPLARGTAGLNGAAGQASDGRLPGPESNGSANGTE